jgi:hypothetical protein
MVPFSCVFDCIHAWNFRLFISEVDGVTRNAVDKFKVIPHQRLAECSAHFLQTITSYHLNCVTCFNLAASFIHYLSVAYLSSHCAVTALLMQLVERLTRVQLVIARHIEVGWRSE